MEIKIEKGEVYSYNTVENPNELFIKREGGAHIYPKNSFFCNDSKYNYFNGWIDREAPINVRRATPEEICWLETCERSGEFVGTIKTFEPKTIQTYETY